MLAEIYLVITAYVISVSEARLPRYPFSNYYGHNFLPTTGSHSYYYRGPYPYGPAAMYPFANPGYPRYPNYIYPQPIYGDPYGMPQYAVTTSPDGSIKIFMLPPFPPFIEAIVQRIQNYFSTYNELSDLQIPTTEGPGHDSVEEDLEVSDEDDQDPPPEESGPSEAPQEIVPEVPTSTPEPSKDLNVVGPVHNPFIQQTSPMRPPINIPEAYKPYLFNYPSTFKFGPYIDPDRDSVVVEAEPTPPYSYLDYRYLQNPIPYNPYNIHPDYYRVPEPDNYY